MAVFANLFGESPFRAVREHSEKVHRCVALVEELFAIVKTGDTEKLKRTANEVFELETEADRLRNQIHQQLSKAVLMPISRSELFELVEQQDSIADRAEDIAALLTCRKLSLPESMMSAVSEFLGSILQNCKLAEGIFSKLDLLVESSFRGRDAITVTKIINELEEREDETKGQKIELIRKIFTLEEQLSPVELMLWSQIINQIADLSKYAEGAANGIRLMIETK